MYYHGIDHGRGLLAGIDQQENQLAFEKERFEKMLKMQCLELACKTGIKAYEVVEYAQKFLIFVEGK
jgi:hypothetical protein